LPTEGRAQGGATIFIILGFYDNFVISWSMLVVALITVSAVIVCTFTGFVYVGFISLWKTVISHE
jgi:hypothetical protein